ncbi:MAG: hypothetical protein KAJ12_12365 [Bacteroidetes bacterium]|nr:hypothetical protein [Bacteroidota bacterium]
MEKHITVVGVLNIVYSSLNLLGAAVLVGVAAGSKYIVEVLYQRHVIHPYDVPYELWDIIPAVLILVAFLLAIFSLPGIIGGIGVLKRKEWGRIVVLVISFFNLLSIPLGTILGAYSIWAMMTSETVRLFSPEKASAPSDGG